jgi:hypothetical protein
MKLKDNLKKYGRVLRDLTPPIYMFDLLRKDVGDRENALIGLGKFYAGMILWAGILSYTHSSIATGNFNPLDHERLLYERRLEKRVIEEKKKIEAKRLREKISKIYPDLNNDGRVEDYEEKEFCEENGIKNIIDIYSWDLEKLERIKSKRPRSLVSKIE